MSKYALFCGHSCYLGVGLSGVEGRDEVEPVRESRTRTCTAASEIILSDITNNAMAARTLRISPKRLAKRPKIHKI